MTRKIVMAIVMAFAVGFVGCRACLAPYDCCQPTFLPERGDQCMGELYRCGSILGGMDRSSNANGYCESCGGGSVEYYSASEFGASAVSSVASDSTRLPSTQLASTQLASAELASSQSATQIPTEIVADSRYVARQASFDMTAESSNVSGFTLNDDSSEAY